MSITVQIQEKFKWLTDFLNERHLRLWAGAEALSLGRGGISRVARAAGLSRKTVRAGIRELLTGAARSGPQEPERVRRPGAGRKPLLVKTPTLLPDLEALLEPAATGEPTAVLRWTCKSTMDLAGLLRARGHAISPRKVAQLLHQLGYTLRTWRQTRDGPNPAERENQFRHINGLAQDFEERSQPGVVLAIGKTRQDTAAVKEEGPQATEETLAVSSPAFLGPCPVCDRPANGWRGLEPDSATVAFGVAGVRRWWQQVGRECCPAPRELLVVCAATGTDDFSSALWKPSLQALAEETGLRVVLCHLPTATLRWSASAEQAFSYATECWLDQHWVRHAVVIKTIGHPEPASHVPVLSREAANECSPPLATRGRKTAATVRIDSGRFHQLWNAVIEPVIDQS